MKTSCAVSRAGEALYFAAAEVVAEVIDKQATIKAVCYNFPDFRNQAKLVALASETLRCMLAAA